MRVHSYLLSWSVSSVSYLLRWSVSSVSYLLRWSVSTSVSSACCWASDRLLQGGEGRVEPQVLGELAAQLLRRRGHRTSGEETTVSQPGGMAGDDQWRETSSKPATTWHH